MAHTQDKKKFIGFQERKKNLNYKKRTQLRKQETKVNGTHKKKKKIELREESN